MKSVKEKSVKTPVKKVIKEVEKINVKIKTKKVANNKVVKKPVKKVIKEVEKINVKIKTKKVANNKVVKKPVKKVIKEVEKTDVKIKTKKVANNKVVKKPVKKVIKKVVKTPVKKVINKIVKTPANRVVAKGEIADAVSKAKQNIDVNSDSKVSDGSKQKLQISGNKIITKTINIDKTGVSGIFGESGAKDINKKKPEKLKEVVAPAKAGKLKFDKNSIVASVKRSISSGSNSNVHEQLFGQRPNIDGTFDSTNRKKKGGREFVLTGVPGFDELLTQGIPRGNTLLVAGGAGSGKTIFCLQTLIEHASQGEKCLYMSFEESKERLVEHMNDFGWNPDKFLKNKKLYIKRFNPFDITRSVDALLMKAKGELLIDVEPVVLPENFKPDFIVVDSLTAIASAFSGKEDSYRIYIEQLFRFFEKINATAFLITETEQIPKVFSQSGVEEFLADGVIVFYNIKRGNLRENAIEVLKLRGAKHQKKIVAMQITDHGIMVYPDQELFVDLDQ